MNLVIDSLGDEIVSRNLLRIAGHAGDLQPAMESILTQIREGEKQQFTSQGSYGSGGWKPLAESTKAYKAKHGLDPRILIATGALRDSVTGGSGEYVAAGRDSLIFGTTVPYAKYHQKTRPIAQFPESARRAWVKTIQDYVLGSGETS